MKLNKFFSLKRFGRLLSADLRLNSKRYLFTIAGGAIGIYLLLLFGMLSNQNYTVNTGYYVIMFNFSILGLGAYIGSVFPSLSENKTTANYLLFPASHFEKFLSQFLLYYVAGAIVFVFLFWMDAHLVRLSLSNLENVRNGTWIIEPFNFRKFFPYTNQTSIIAQTVLTVMIYLSIGGFLFTTRIFFRKFALAKSVISGVALFFLTAFVLVLFSHLFFPDYTKGFNIGAPIYDSLWGLNNWKLLFDSIFAIILIFFLPLAYFKLKEKQV